jgi:hypothetical protein
MLRKTCLLTFVLLFICDDTVLARRGKCRFRQRRCVSPCCCPCERRFDYYYCLQDFYLDYPGQYDIYLCLTHEGFCPNLGAYEDLWYGDPDYPAPGPNNTNPPQVCNILINNCERGYGYGGGPPPGHGEQFTMLDEACVWIHARYPHSTNPRCRYYEIPHSSSGLGKTYYVVMVKAHVPNTGGPRYFGVETRQLMDTPETASFSNVRKKGNVLSFDYKIGAQTRKGLVLLE